MSLGGEPGTANYIAPKPKGMWQRTYAARVEEILRLEEEADALFFKRFLGLLREEELRALLN
ncbi:hypothetical protein V8J82_18175 [Gymnodinialimonas sp. 2305UL16-5]|uniref:hypothetical protein n=1 Tax=Gymnodinialimonas mytili TaxID=3126503 RepID=UPI0030A2835D